LGFRYGSQKSTQLTRDRSRGGKSQCRWLEELIVSSQKERQVSQEPVQIKGAYEEEICHDVQELQFIEESC